jgi:hypothetical protein
MTYDIWYHQVTLHVYAYRYACIVLEKLQTIAVGSIAAYRQDQVLLNSY